MCHRMSILNATLQLAINQAQLTLASFAKQAHDLNRKDLRRSALEALCRLLHGATNGFLAQHNIAALGVHQAVMDVLAYKTDNVLSLLNVNIGTFLSTYKADYQLTLLPTPSFPYGFERVLASINGPPPGQLNDASAPAPAAATTNPTVQHAPAPPTSVQPPAPAPAAAAAAVPLPGGTTTPAPAPRAVGFTTAAAVSQSQARGQPLQPRFDALTGVRLNPYATPATTNGRPTHALDGTPILYLDNAAVAGAQRAAGQDDDATMADVHPQPAQPAPIVGGRVAFLADMVQLIQVAGDAREVFLTKVQKNEEARRIKKAAAQAQLTSAAERIAATVAAERPATTPVLRGVVRTETERANQQLRRQVQSLQATVSNLTLKQGRGNARRPAQDFQGRSGRAAGRGPSKNQGRGGVVGRGNATTAASRKSNQRPSSSSAAGNGRASNNRRRS